MKEKQEGNALLPISRVFLEKNLEMIFIGLNNYLRIKI